MPELRNIGPFSHTELKVKQTLGLDLNKQLMRKREDFSGFITFGRDSKSQMIFNLQNHIILYTIVTIKIRQHLATVK